MSKCRDRAPILHPVLSLTAEEHASIKQGGIGRELDWSTSTGLYGALIAKFRAEVKSHYYLHQRRRCCYCSVELHSHKLTYDAEHILDKEEYVEYMFEAANLAAACKFCNGSKSNKPISTSGDRFVELSKDGQDYSIVHPHLDEWHDHLRFDDIGRIVAKGASDKGRETIRICGMAALNAARLADEFAIENSKEAEMALRIFHEVESVARKRELLTLLSELAKSTSLPGARVVMQALQQDVGP